MKIQGRAMWASVQIPNMKYEHTWQIDLVIEDKQVAGAKKAGLKVKKTEHGNIVVFRRRVIRKDGGENKKPTVVDAKKNPLLCLVGNGSLVNVQFGLYEYDNSFGKGTGVDLQSVQVLELVEYNGTDGAEFEVEEEDTIVIEGSDADEVEDSDGAAKKDFDDDLPDVL